jgi:hypothetical protein
MAYVQRRETWRLQQASYGEIPYDLCFRLLALLVLLALLLRLLAGRFVYAG